MSKSKAVLERASRFLEEMGTPVTKFCQRVKLAGSTFYAWRAGTVTLSEETLNRIDGYLKQYSF